MGLRWRARLGAIAMALALSGCATAQTDLPDDVFHVQDRFRITVPGAPWTVVRATDSELELRHPRARAGILAHATCGPETAREPLDVLVRRLFIGMRTRETLENGTVTVDGLPAVRTVLDAEVAGEEDRMRLEAWVIKDGRCVYDLVYVAPPPVFSERYGDFTGVVESFTRD